MPSATIDRIDYDEATQVLSIWFVATGRRYDYQGVPPELVERFCKAVSKGRFFNAFIRDAYPAQWMAWDGMTPTTGVPAELPPAEPNASNVIPFPAHKTRS